MKTWFARQWNDPVAFVGTVRWTMVILGGLFATNQIPTGINGLGPIIGIVLNAFAVKLTAGDRTAEDVKRATEKITGIPPDRQE